MNFKLHIVTVLLIFTMGASGQQTLKPSRLSCEMNAGVPVIISSVTPALATYGGAGIRYNLTAAISVQAAFNLGIMRGAQNVNATTAAEQQQSYTKYHNTFYQYTLRGQLNLERVFKLRASLKRINPYITGGVGYTGTMGIEAERNDGRLRKYNDINFWTVQTGIVIRYYLNPVLDLNIGSELNLTQTKFLDGIPLDNRFDHFVMTYVGVNIKIGAKKQNQHIEWSNKPHRNKVSPKKKDDSDDKTSAQVLTEDEPDEVHADSLMAEESDPDKAAEKVSKDKPASADSEQQTSIPLPVVPTKEAFAAARSVAGPKNLSASVVASTSGIAAPAAKDKKTGTSVAATTTAKAKAGKAASAKTTTGTATAGTKTNRAAGVNNNTRNNGMTAAITARPYALPIAPIVRVSAPVDPKAPTLNFIEGIARPVSSYNVIVGAFRKSKNAYAFRDKMRKMGYQCAIFRSDINSQILRVCIYSTNDKAIALKQLEKARVEIEKGAWVHVYYK
jgi:hypothetical protein